jgi:hypothetical protein
MYISIYIHTYIIDIIRVARGGRRLSELPACRHVCSRMLTYADVAGALESYEAGAMEEAEGCDRYGSTPATVVHLERLLLLLLLAFGALATLSYACAASLAWAAPEYVTHASAGKRHISSSVSTQM